MSRLEPSPESPTVSPSTTRVARARTALRGTRDRLVVRRRGDVSRSTRGGRFASTTAFREPLGSVAGVSAHPTTEARRRRASRGRTPLGRRGDRLDMLRAVSSDRPEGLTAAHWRCRPSEAPGARRADRERSRAGSCPRRRAPSPPLGGWAGAPCPLRSGAPRAAGARGRAARGSHRRGPGPRWARDLGHRGPRRSPTANALRRITSSSSSPPGRRASSRGL